MDKKTTVQVTQKTKDRLNEIGKKGETYDEIINKLIDSFHKEMSDEEIDAKLHEIEILEQKLQ